MSFEEVAGNEVRLKRVNYILEHVTCLGGRRCMPFSAGAVPVMLP